MSITGIGRMKARRFRALDHLAALQASQPLPQTSTVQPVRESAPFVITQLQILMMASACLSAQEIADCLDRDAPIDERKQVAHGS